MNKNAQVLPVDIPLPENTPLEGGAVFVRLTTPDALEAFWLKHRATLPYAATGCAHYGPEPFLREHEWVFAPSKSALVKAFTRWDAIGIACEWYDWAADRPAEHADFFVDLSEEEARGRTPANYRGWWKLRNLPLGLKDLEWFESFEIDTEVIDPSLGLDEVARKLQELTFDVWVDPYGEGSTEVKDANGVDIHLRCWREELHGRYQS
ncbi:hypothetical protein AB4Y45_32160 [Paraburkholderia sp. EG287A]|uniref:hypothetical protein n=1 Tax=Paraburkholderia sp. EG287A TaxID=3237012 RepID=UPI0034D2F468